MKKILILNVNLGYGGAEKNIAFVANSLSEVGNDVTLLTYRENNNEQGLDPKIRRVHLQLERSGGKLLQIVPTVLSIRRFIKKGQYDLAIAFLTPSQLRLRLSCLFTKTKVVFSHRSDPFTHGTSIKQRLITWFYERIFCSADFFVFQTEKAKEYFNKKIDGKSIIIPNSIVPLSREKNREVNQNRIVNVARLEMRQKRQDLLIEAFNQFSERYPQYTLEFYGDGPDQKKITELAKSNSKIRICGRTDNVAHCIENASMFVLTSDYEGIPNALLEAMSLGVPCISTDCSPGGARMLISSKKYGQIVPVSNKEALVSAMEYYANNIIEAEIIGKNGMYVNDFFSVNKIKEMWCNYISECN